MSVLNYTPFLLFVAIFFQGCKKEYEEPTMVNITIIDAASNDLVTDSISIDLKESEEINSATNKTINTNILDWSYATSGQYSFSFYAKKNTNSKEYSYSYHLDANTPIEHYYFYSLESPMSQNNLSQSKPLNINATNDIDVILYPKSFLTVSYKNMECPTPTQFILEQTSIDFPEFDFLTDVNTSGCTDEDGTLYAIPSGKILLHWYVTRNGTTDIFSDTLNLAKGEYAEFEINY